MRLKKTLAVGAAASLAAIGLAAGTGTAHASNPVPYPAGLAGHPFAEAWTPTGLYQWGPGSNSPGNCSSSNEGEVVNHTSYVQLSTSGATGDCNDLQSPHEYPTADGYVYEAKIEVSNWTQWNAYWGYGSNWPTDGEIDAVEGGSGQNYVSYHYEGSSGPAAVSNCNSSNGCDANAGPITSPSNTNTLVNIAPGVHVIDYTFGRCGSGCGSVSVWYDGTEVAFISGSNVLNHGNADDPFWIVFDTGSCNSASNGNVCGSSGQTSGWTKVYYLRAFT